MMAAVIVWAAVSQGTAGEAATYVVTSGNLTVPAYRFLTIDPKQVVLAGPQSLVAHVTRVQVNVNITGVREGLDQSVDILALDQNNARVTSVTIQPSVAHVTMPVTRQGGFRDLAVCQHILDLAPKVAHGRREVE